MPRWLNINLVTVLIAIWAGPPLCVCYMWLQGSARGTQQQEARTYKVRLTTSMTAEDIHRATYLLVGGVVHVYSPYSY